jgi:hypothetical protein
MSIACRSKEVIIEHPKCHALSDLSEPGFNPILSWTHYRALMRSNKSYPIWTEKMAKTHYLPTLLFDALTELPEHTLPGLQGRLSSGCEQAKIADIMRPVPPQIMDLRHSKNHYHLGKHSLYLTRL